MRLPRSFPSAVKPTVLAGVAAVTVVASLTASVTGAVRPVRSRSGRLYRPPSAVNWRVPHALVRSDDRMSMRDAIAAIRSDAAQVATEKVAAEVTVAAGGPPAETSPVRPNAPKAS